MTTDGLTWTSTCIRNYIHYKVWDRITYAFPNFHATKFQTTLGQGDPSGAYRYNIMAFSIYQWPRHFKQNYVQYKQLRCEIRNFNGEFVYKQMDGRWEFSIFLSLRKQQETTPKALQWRQNKRDGVSNHQPHDCLLNRLFRRRSKKTSKLRVTDLCAGNSPVTGEFPALRASNAENVFVWWRHHDSKRPLQKW